MTVGPRELASVTGANVRGRKPAPKALDPVGQDVDAVQASGICAEDHEVDE
jgi:hypothetical protein